MSDPTPKFTASPITPGKENIFLGLQSPYFIKTAQEKVPGLHEKLSNVREGQIPNLSEPEKEFLINWIMNEELGPGVFKVITDTAERIWRARMVEWKQFGKTLPSETIVMAFWGHFTSPSLTREKAKKLIDFYLGTTKEQAEAEVSDWAGWKGTRTNIKLVK